MPQITPPKPTQSAAPVAPVAPLKTKAQPWKGHWPPTKQETDAPYGFRAGETIVIGGN